MSSENREDYRTDGPTTAEWRRLYEAALAFRDAAPWNWMTEDDLFGVRDPETGVTYYACIMGELGEHRALALYQGSEGLAGYWQICLEPPDDPIETLALQFCLMASFEDREGLEQADRDIIKGLGLKVRGRGAWPLFRSFLPGFAPWFVTGAQARFLVLGLEQALLVARRVQEDPRWLSSPEAIGGLYLVRVFGQDGVWRDIQAAPAPLEQPMEEWTPDLDTDHLRHLRKTLPKTRGVLEMDYFVSPSGVFGDDGGRPFFPYLILAADQGSGMLLATDLSRPDAIGQNLGEIFLTVVESLQMLPARVQVAREEAQEFLMPFARPLGVQVKLVSHLKTLDTARDQMALFLAGGGLGFDPVSLMEEVAESLPDDEEPSLPSPRRPKRTPSATES